MRRTSDGIKMNRRHRPFSLPTLAARRQGFLDLSMTIALLSDSSRTVWTSFKVSGEATTLPPASSTAACSSTNIRRIKSEVGQACPRTAISDNGRFETLATILRIQSILSSPLASTMPSFVLFFDLAASRVVQHLDNFRTLSLSACGGSRQFERRDMQQLSHA